MPGVDLPPSGVILLTGVMAAGKSTVAELLARSAPRGAHVRGDVFRRSVVSGRVEPAPDPSPEALAQLRLRYRLGAATADAYAAAGFLAVWQDVVVGPLLTEAVATVRTRPRYVVVLDPDPSTVRERESGRGKTGYGGGWSPASLVAALRHGTPLTGLWLPTDGQSPGETVEVIRCRLGEALVDDLGG